MRKTLSTLKSTYIVIKEKIIDFLRELKSNRMISDNDNFNHLLYYSLDCWEFVPIFAQKLIIEYHHAKSENLNAGKYFLVDMQRFSEYLKLDKQVVICILYFMEELGLAHYQDSGIENTKLIWIEEEELLRYLPECPPEYNYFEYLQDHRQDEEHKFFDYLPKYKKEPKALFTWDNEYENKYKKKSKISSFSNTTNVFRQFINKNLKNANIIPLATYAYCNGQFLFNDIPLTYITDRRVKEQIRKCINMKDFKPTNLIELIESLCDKYFEQE